MRNAFVVAILLAMLTACGGDTPTSPTAFEDNWYPCVGLHIPGNAVDAQMDALQQLVNADRVQWVRFDPQDDIMFEGTARPYYNRADAMGLNIMTIIHQTHLFSAPSWIDAFEGLRQQYPETDIWNIAGEVTNPDPNVNPNGVTTITEFFEKFKELYYYIENWYPGVRLTSPPTFGSAGGPGGELEPFFEQGILELENVIVAINLYSQNAFVQYNDVFHNSKWSKALQGKKVWITETGIPDSSQHLNWVQSMYKDFEDAFAPEMVCYYSFWEGGLASQFESQTRPPYEEYGMITDLNPQTGSFTPRTLYSFLARR